ncbi:MAG: lipid A biosynthesis acyltransferase [Gammaproteobacteria bacterium]|nr:lipid A biosynthesis acyltransferase [Gammaproteobacteria bacterium]
MIKFVFKLFSVMPLWLNHLIGGLIGRVLYWTNGRSKKISKRNIELCFAELTQAQQAALVKKSLIETGKGLSESGFVWFNSFEHNASCIKKIKGLEYLFNESNTILLVPHFGCWEIAARVVSLHKPTTFMYKALPDKKQNALLLSVRQQRDLAMATADKRGVLKLHRALKARQLIAILPDQYPGEEGSILSTFFAQKAVTMTLLAKMARKNNAKVLMTWAQRLDKGRGYELNFKPVDILSESGVLEEDVARMNQAIEALIRTKPEQYLWNYKRFKGVIQY